jgi:ABC-type maltose transport system permease subunit
MDRYATAFVDWLEQATRRFRVATVGRARHVVDLSMVGMVAATLVFVAALFLVVGLFRAVGELIGVITAYAVFGGIFVGLGWLVWRRRDPAPPSQD